MAKILLTIGHHSWLLPNDAGVMSVIKVMSKAIPCYDHSYRGVIQATEITSEKVEIRYLSPKDKIAWPKDEEPSVSEQLRLEEPKSIIL